MGAMTVFDKRRERTQAAQEEERLDIRTRLDDALAPYLGTELFIDLRVVAPQPGPRRRRNRPIRLVRRAQPAA